MEKSNKIRYWVETLPKIGKNVFTLEEVAQQFPTVDAVNIRNTLYRLTKKNMIQSVWHGFYVIIPVDYGLKGVVPPTEYIDRLMRYLGKEYYVGLLNAAALHGAAHQQPQEFTVVVNDKNLRGKAKKGVKINFITRYDLPTPYLKQLNTRSGYIRISSAELTAMDLIHYMKEIGGVNRAATILNELAEEMDFQNVKADFFSYFCRSNSFGRRYLKSKYNSVKLLEMVVPERKVAPKSLPVLSCPVLNGTQCEKHIQGTLRAFGISRTCNSVVAGCKC